MVYLLFVLLTFLISAAIGWFSIPRVVVIAKMKRLFDDPDPRKVHTGAVPRLGGLTFFPAALFSFCFVLGLRYYYGYDILLGMQTELWTELLFVISGMLILYFVGLVDDLIGVSYRSKFLAQILAAGCLVFAGATLFDLQGLLGVSRLHFITDVALTIGLVVLTINAFNLIDGVDGLCSGLATIILTSLGGFYIWAELYVYAMFAFGMTGVLLVFFQYNILGTRLKIFMGDTGSLTVGFLVVYLGLKFVNTTVEQTHLESSMALFVGLLFVPIFDTFRVFVSRVSRGKSPFYPDKNHIHHKLLQLNYSHLQSTGMLLLVQVGYIALNFLLSEVARVNINLVVLTDIIVGVSFNLWLNFRISHHGRPLEEDAERDGRYKH